MKITEITKKSINNFSINEEEYSALTQANNITTFGKGSVFLRGPRNQANIIVDFKNTKGCKVFLGDYLSGNISVSFKGNNSLLFIGNGCTLNGLDIRSFQSDDFIAIGNGVTTTAKNTWISGHAAGNAKPAIIVGDDCMFAYDIVIRNSDAHPIFSLETDKQINEPKDMVHIEPHVWIGEQVNILKSVRIGACSILSLGCVVTKDIPRFSVASGVPAIATLKREIFWARKNSKKAKDEARYFVNRFKHSE